MSQDDAEAIFGLRSDPRVMQWFDRPRAQKLEDAQELIRSIEKAVQSNEGITWGIQWPEDSLLIGTIGFWRIIKEHYRAEIGYMLHPDYHGQGLMREAMEAVLEYGFGRMNLHSVEANINPGNLASAKLLEKSGFVKEAHFRENYYYDGKFIDTVIYSRISDL